MKTPTKDTPVSERKWTKGESDVLAILDRCVETAYLIHQSAQGNIGAAKYEKDVIKARNTFVELHHALSSTLPFAMNMLGQDHPIVAKARAALQRAEGEET